MSKIYDRLFPDDSPLAVRRWRLTVSQALIVLVVFAIFTATSMFSGLPPLGRIAWAGEVDEKIEKAIAPIQSQLAEIKIQLVRGEDVQRRILIGQISAQLRDLHRVKCTSGDELVRQRMERDIEDSQQEYRALTGERYPLPACMDL